MTSQSRQTDAAGSLIARGSRLEKPAAVVSGEGVDRQLDSLQPACQLEVSVWAGLSPTGLH